MATAAPQATTSGTTTRPISIPNPGRLHADVFTLTHHLAADLDPALQRHIHHHESSCLRVHFDRARLVSKIKPTPGNGALFNEHPLQRHRPGRLTSPHGNDVRHSPARRLAQYGSTRTVTPDNQH